MKKRILIKEKLTVDERKIRMEKKYIPTFLFICAALLTIGFAVNLYFDYTLDYKYGSSPYVLYVMVRFAEYMLLAIGCFVAGIIIRKKSKKGEADEE